MKVSPVLFSQSSGKSHLLDRRKLFISLPLSPSAGSSVDIIYLRVSGEANGIKLGRE